METTDAELESAIGTDELESVEYTIGIISANFVLGAWNIYIYI